MLYLPSNRSAPQELRSKRQHWRQSSFDCYIIEARAESLMVLRKPQAPQHLLGHHTQIHGSYLTLCFAIEAAHARTVVRSIHSLGAED